MTVSIARGTIPQDAAPMTDDIPPTTDDAPTTSDEETTGWYNAEYPYSTEEHPYGYFPVSATNSDPDFSRPRKRRPHGRGVTSGGSVASSTRADKVAETAANLLCRINSLVGISLATFGMPLSGAQIMEGNETFRGMAYEALQTDPVLARKILSAGATSGKAQLTMAYVVLFGTITPTAMQEIKERRKESENDDA